MTWLGRLGRLKHKSLGLGVGCRTRLFTRRLGLAGDNSGRFESEFSSSEDLDLNLCRRGDSLLTEPSSELVSASSAWWPEARRLANRPATASNWFQDSISQSEQTEQCKPSLWQNRWSEHFRWCVHGSDCTNLVANLEQ